MFVTPFITKMLLLATYLANKLSAEEILVRLSHGGEVRGTILRSKEDRLFYAFRGIPYAEPPIGELSFKAPVPKAGWGSTPFDAMVDGPICFQHDSSMTGSEDCLVLNVYTPEIPNAYEIIRKRAVMVYIHGGSFLVGDGTSNSLSPRPLMDYDILLVTINYRLGALGFLSTGDAASLGNYGMLDQRLALIWVKDNIEAFGGDAQSITLFGHSAGGASVSYHLLSPLSKGLFHRAISMSGSSLNPWAFEHNSIYWARQVAKEAGCPEESTEELMSCLKSKPAEALRLGAMNYLDTSVPFTPTVDGYFLPANPKEMLKSPGKFNNVTVMTGVTAAERAALVWTSYKYSKPGAILSDGFTQKIFNNSISNQIPKIICMIKDRYLAHLNRSNELEYVKAIIEALSHGLFDMNHYEEVKLLSEAGLTVYAYSYNYVAKSLEEKLFSHIEPVNASSHGDELYLIFDVDDVGKLNLTENDERMAKILMQLWTNFAKNGHPDPTNQYHLPWKPSSPDVIHIHHLDLELTSKEYAVNDDEYFHFWTNDVYLARTAVTNIASNKKITFGKILQSTFLIILFLKLYH